MLMVLVLAMRRFVGCRIYWFEYNNNVCCIVIALFSRRIMKYEKPRRLHLILKHKFMAACQHRWFWLMAPAVLTFCVIGTRSTVELFNRFYYNRNVFIIADSIYYRVLSSTKHVGNLRFLLPSSWIKSRFPNGPRKKTPH